MPLKLYLTGYKRDPHRRRLISAQYHPHLMGVEATRATVSLDAFAPPIFDQGQTGSCVGHARSRGLFTARAAAGKPLLIIPSPAGLYRLARCYGRANWNAALFDEGSDPVNTIDAVSEFGVREMGPMAPDGRFSDADPTTINALPTLDELEQDRQFRFLDDYQITDAGLDRLELVQKALSAGLPVCLDVAGGSAQFQEYTTGILRGSDEPLDHYVILMGYDLTHPEIRFHGHNSWGTQWGIAGTFTCDASLVAAAQDLIVCVEHGL